MATTVPQRAPLSDPIDEATPAEASQPRDVLDLASGPDARTVETPDQDVQPTDEDIRLEAYLLHIRNGSREHRELDDWLEAERRLRPRGSE